MPKPQVHYGIIGGTIRYPLLTNDLTDEEYDKRKIGGWLKMLNNQERPVKWGKPGKRGTSVKYETICTPVDMEAAWGELEGYIRGVNKAYGLNIELTRREEVEKSNA